MRNNTIKGDTTLRDFFRVLFRHKVVSITPVIILMITVYIGLNLYTPTHTAIVKLGVYGIKPTMADYYKDLGMREGVVLAEGEIVKSNPIIERAVGALGLYALPLDYEKRFAPRLKKLLLDYKIRKLKLQIDKLEPERARVLLFNNAVKDLKGRVRVEPLRGTNMFTINVSDFSPAGAVIIANVLSRVYVIYDLERQLAEFRLEYGEKHPITMQVKDKINELQKYLDGRPLPDIEAIGPASVKIIEQAKDSTPVIRYNKKLLLILTFFLGVVLGILFAFGVEYLDKTLKSPQDIETFLNIPFLGSIPKRKSKDKLLITDTNTNNRYVQFYQDLTDQISLLMKDKKLKAVLITDVEPSEDTAAVVANICICLTHKEVDQNVLIIDANLRNPSISKVFNISNSPGLTDVLEGRILFEDAVQNLGANLSVLPAGSTMFNPSTLLNSSKMSDVVKTAIKKYDSLFFTCADLKNFTDAVVLSSITDGLVFVINEGKVRRHIVKFAITPLEHRKANLLGAILNNRELVIPKVVYDRL